MADEDKTRILTWQDVGGTPPEVEPRIVDEKIMFACPNGHTLRVPLELGGKRGKCSKCGVPLQIPAVQHEEESLPVIDTGSNEPVVDEVPPFIDVSVTAKSPPAAATQPSPAGPARVPPPVDDPGTEDWNFEVAGQTAPAAPPGAWQSVDDGHANPTARLVARLWAERTESANAVTQSTRPPLVRNLSSCKRVPAWKTTRSADSLGKPVIASPESGFSG